MAFYLVTGGAGFIGSHLVEALLQAGHDVRVLDNFSTGHRENLRTLKQKFPSRLKIQEGDIRDPQVCRRAVSGSEFVFHEAAQVSVPASVADPETTQEINIKGTLNLLSAGRKAGIKRLVLASSTSVYGDGADEAVNRRAKHENLPPCPLSPYALSKLVGEYYCRIFSNLYGLEALALRYFNVYGPRQDPRSEYAAVIPKFIERLLLDRPPVIYGDGGQSRDFVFIKDVVQANLLACHRSGLAGQVFNIASGRSYTLLQLFKYLQKILKSSHEPEFAPVRPGDIRHSRADIRKAKGLLGFQPAYDLRRGLEATVGSMTGKG
jgi:nucleoside-diphosphate-sugar epimerase